MKRTIAVMLTLILAFSVITPSAFAATAADASDETLVFTTTETVSQKNENGQWVVLETRTSQVSQEELDTIGTLSSAADVSPLTVGYTQYRKNASFENGAVELSLNAKFEYEPGDHVDCVSKTGSITKNSYGWLIMYKDIKTSKNFLGTRASATMEVILKTTAGYEREYSVTVTCTRDGAVS